MSRLQSTQQHDQKDELHRLLIESVKDYAIFAIDPNGQIRSWNLGAEQLLGYPTREVIGKPAALLFTPEDIKCGMPLRDLLKVREDGRSEVARWHVRKDGSRFWSVGSTIALRDSDLNVRGFAMIVRDSTTQRYIDDALKDSLAFVQGIVEAVRESLLVLSSDLRVKTANRSFYETFRVSEGETQGQLIYHIGNHQWDIPRLRTLLEEILPQKTSFDGFEVEHEFKSIGRKVMLLNARRLSQQGSQTELILLAIEDITDRRRTEEKREELETRFTSLVKNINDYAIMTMNLEGQFTSWNKEAERILDYTEAEVLGRPFSLIFTPEDVGQNQPLLELKVAKEAGRATDDRWHLRKDGQRIWSSGIVTPTRGAKGQITGFSKILRDMTQQKQEENELRHRHNEAEKRARDRTSDLQKINSELQLQVGQRQQSEESLRLRDRAIQAVSQGILITDPNLPDNPIIYVSHGFERITGYPADEALGRNCRFLQGPETDPEMLNVIREAIRSGRECSVELLNYRKDGTKFWNAISVTPVRDDDQRLTYFVGVQADVTKRRTLEQAFQQSQKMQVVGHLASGIAHDFNNLLTVIQGYSEYMLTTMVPSDPMRDPVEAISQAGERAALLTRQLLAFSRQSILQPKILELNTVVLETEKMLRRLIGTRPANLVY
jgi:two-component system cell cycle sensor histidine kinase/response regulator CckA